MKSGRPSVALLLFVQLIFSAECRNIGNSTEALLSTDAETLKPITTKTESSFFVRNVWPIVIVIMVVILISCIICIIVLLYCLRNKKRKEPTKKSQAPKTVSIDSTGGTESTKRSESSKKAPPAGPSSDPQVSTKLPGSLKQTSSQQDSTKVLKSQKQAFSQRVELNPQAPVLHSSPSTPSPNSYIAERKSSPNVPPMKSTPPPEVPQNPPNYGDIPRTPLSANWSETTDHETMKTDAALTPKASAPSLRFGL
ncbi:hypothetical protein L596_007704 [Steinernema carpocapsae]|uniref:Dystroglycan C-terminal domain-containing protein n=1 Tax=Steinernema carpocapsae TaxID=34508 RepID=A0A4U5PA64_STECR|nr:hypothetical protein L596_007704 [Steinernema carpocapsae]